MKIKETYSVFSNITFLIPLFFAIKNSLYVYIIIITSVFVFSTLFHLTKPKGVIESNNHFKLNNFQKTFLWIDVFFANCLIIFNLLVFWQKGFPLQFYYALGVSVVALVIFFSSKEDNYDFTHSVWHILSVVITLLAVL